MEVLAKPAEKEKSRIMESSFVALVSRDVPAVDDVQKLIAQAQGRRAVRTNFDSVAKLLNADSDGLLLILVSSPEDQLQAARLVQSISLQKWPPMLVLLEGPGSPAGKLANLDPFVFRRLHWPEDSHLLGTLTKELGRCRSFCNESPDCLEDLLHQQFLALTPSLLPLVDRIALAANHDVTILLNGETGTGKTFLANIIHQHSPRRQHRFLTVPCGAVSTNLVESEFFGHVRGAFTGADRPKIGKFEAVGEGTLLLDEIDTLGLEQQATLLRVIETGEFEPVGSNETRICHARLIVASNIDLEHAVAEGNFRPDLYFRLNVMSFHLPPLRERVQDIAPLARGMAARFNRKFGKELFDISPQAMVALENFNWPGNLRQLENVIQHAVLVSTGPEILFEHLPAPLQEQNLTPAANGHHNTQNGGDTLHHQRDVIERNVIQRALASHGYSRTRAADSLGISRVTLYKKMKKYGLMPAARES